MSLKFHLIIISICTILCWICWFLVLIFINPQTTAILGFLFFYVSLLLALVGSFVLLGFAARFLFKRNDVVYKQINIASRQALMLSLLTVSVLMLQSHRYLFWWNIIILVILFSLVEAFFLSAQKLRKKS